MNSKNISIGCLKLSVFKREKVDTSRDSYYQGVKSGYYQTNKLYPMGHHLPISKSLNIKAFGEDE